MTPILSILQYKCLEPVWGPLLWGFNKVENPVQTRVIKEFRIHLIILTAYGPSPGPTPNVLDFQNFSPKSLLPVVKGAPAVKTFTALWIPRPVSAVTGSVKASAGVACAAAAGAGAGALGALDAVGIAGAVTRRGERPRRPNCESGAMSGVNGVGILSKG